MGLTISGRGVSALSGLPSPMLHPSDGSSRSRAWLEEDVDIPEAELPRERENLKRRLACGARSHSIPTLRTIMPPHRERSISGGSWSPHFLSLDLFSMFKGNIMLSALLRYACGWGLHLCYLHNQQKLPSGRGSDYTWWSLNWDFTIFWELAFGTAVQRGAYWAAQWWACEDARASCQACASVSREYCMLSLFHWVLWVVAVGRPRAVWESRRLEDAPHTPSSPTFKLVAAEC